VAFINSSWKPGKTCNLIRMCLGRSHYQDW